MRSSKSRSRSKSNRPRTMGNIVNRVFDSSGPEGKVRGTPQQIIEKYLFLARDAQLSNDRVAAENFLQHAEHYTRMLGEAQRELAAEQEARQQQQVQSGQQGQNQNRQDRGDYRGEGRDDRNGEQPYFRHPDVIEPRDPAEDSGLVETPESRNRRYDSGEAASEVSQAETRSEDKPAQRNERPRQPRPPRREPEGVAAPSSPLMPVMPDPAPEEAAPKPDRGPRRPRAPRKPKADGEGPNDGDPREAAE